MKAVFVLIAIAFVALAAVYAPWFLLLAGIISVIGAAAVWVFRRLPSYR